MDASAPKEKIISIVTPSLNQGEFIGETIRSVLGQEGDFYIDYVIRDGGSKDESVRIIESYQELLEQNCDVVEKSGLNFHVPRTSSFRWNRCRGISYRWSSGKDEGQADAINRGMHAAKGQVAAFINSDDVYCAGAFRKVLECNWAESDFVYGKGAWISREGFDLLEYPISRPTKNALYYQCTLCQPAVFVKLNTFSVLGDFSHEYRCAFDYEYWLRAAFRECRFTFLDESLARSRMHRSNKSLREKTRVTAEGEALRRQYYGNASWLRSPGLWLAYLTVELPTHLRNHLLSRRLARVSRC